MEELFKWDVYEITSDGESLVGVSLRGRLRKYAGSVGLNLLTDNAADKDNCVRFATLAKQDVTEIESFLDQTVPGAHAEKVLTEVINPVLSKLTIVTDEAKY